MKVANLLGEDEGINWLNYMFTTPIWVTETNCNWEDKVKPVRDTVAPDAEE